MKAALRSFASILVIGITILASPAIAQRVWIMGSNVILRSEPNRQSAEVARLQYWDQFSLVSVSDFREKIDIGEVCDDWGYPWVQVKNENGVGGWVYGRYCFIENDSQPLTASLADGRSVSVFFASDVAQGPVDMEGLTGCETLTLVLLRVDGMAHPAGIRMGDFIRLNESRGYASGKTPPVQQWLLLTQNEGYSQSLTALEAVKADGVECLQLRMFVTYQDGESENVLTLGVSPRGVWQILDYKKGEIGFSND